MSDIALKTRNICKKYIMGTQEINALVDNNITINRGEFVAVTGTSGSGKSTLLHILGGLDKPSSGEVYLGDIRFDNMRDAKLAKLRRESIGFVFQKFCLIGELSVTENICLPILLCDKKPDYAHINEICDILGLSDRQKHLPSQLSGGQQQRVAIARALANDPSIILCDEPTGNLDKKNSTEVIDLLYKIHELYNKTILIVTHDNEIAQRAPKCIRLEDGMVVGIDEQ